MAFSIAPLLKRQNQLPAFGHGWIMSKDGKRWHPSHSQRELLNELTGNGSKKKWQSKLKATLFN
jgi:hypothetical protein